MNYYPHHIGDYRSDTSHLTLLEHGVYRQLLDWYYMDETPLTTDLPCLNRKLGARSESEREAVESVLADFFVLSEDGYFHTRCDEEIAIYKGKAGNARENGKKGGRPRRRSEDNADLAETLGCEEPRITQLVIFGNPDITQSKPNPNPEITGSKANQEPRTKNQEPRTNNLVIPSEVTGVPVQEIVELFNSVFPELPRVQKISESRRKAVKRRWHENPALRGLDAWSKFFNYVKASDFLMGRTPKPWHGMCFDWLFNPTNFTKIYEGNYHGGGQ